MAAVAQDGRALQFARQALRSDREIVLCKLTGGRGTLAVDKDQGQISTASLVAMQTDTTVQSLDLKFSYFGRKGAAAA